MYNIVGIKEYQVFFRRENLSRFNKIVSRYELFVKFFKLNTSISAFLKMFDFVYSLE